MTHEEKAEAFLTHLAIAGQVSAKTQNQAFSALLFLYKDVLGTPLGDVDASACAKTIPNMQAHRTIARTDPDISRRRRKPATHACVSLG